MNELLLIASSEIQPEIRLHPGILDVLFSHKNEISKKLSDIKGLHCIDHIAITIFSPEREVVVFSLTPSVEYNIIIQELWKDDITFTPDKHKKNTIIRWDQNNNTTQNQIKKIKQTDHNFSLGFNIYKKVDKFDLVYSFATRSKNKQIIAHYLNIKMELIQLGDFSYKLIRDIYRNYCISHEPPTIISSYGKPKHHLKLIVNNE